MQIIVIFYSPMLLYLCGLEIEYGIFFYDFRLEILLFELFLGHGEYQLILVTLRSCPVLLLFFLKSFHFIMLLIFSANNKKTLILLLCY